MFAMHKKNYQNRKNQEIYQKTTESLGFCSFFTVL